jgi:hypothetical protein
LMLFVLSMPQSTFHSSAALALVDSDWLLLLG